jgi:hypothetical protein
MPYFEAPSAPFGLPPLGAEGSAIGKPLPGPLFEPAGMPSEPSFFDAGQSGNFNSLPSFFDAGRSGNFNSLPNLSRNITAPNVTFPGYGTAASDPYAPQLSNAAGGTAFTDPLGGMIGARPKSALAPFQASPATGLSSAGVPMSDLRRAFDPPVPGNVADAPAPISAPSAATTTRPRTGGPWVKSESAWQGGLPDWSDHAAPAMGGLSDQIGRGYPGPLDLSDFGANLPGSVAPAGFLPGPPPTVPGGLSGRASGRPGPTPERAASRSGTASPSSSGGRADQSALQEHLQELRDASQTLPAQMQDRALGGAVKAASERSAGGPNTGSAWYDTSQRYNPAGTFAGVT